jgi:hypothetical protein
LQPQPDETASRVQDLIAQAKIIAAEYYKLTGKPLGISGEIAEHDAARLLGMTLSRAREASVDALMTVDDRSLAIQIKGRAVDPRRRYVGRVSKMKLEPRFDAAVLVLMDKADFETLEIWRAEYDDIYSRLMAPGSKARNERLSMGISQFVSIAKKVWPPSECE